MNVIPRPPDASPFDAIRRTRPDGSEFWSARDLMPLMGYGADWRNFKTAVERARVAATNSGHDVETLFSGVTEKTQGRPREDFHLARLAAYLVSLNGDPRKPETAAAQAYFVIRTREAETTPALSGPELLARAVLEADATIKQLAPKAEAFDAFLSTSGDYSVNEAAKILSRDHAILTGEDRLRSWLAANGWIYKDHSGYWSPYQNRIDQGRLAVRVGTPWYHPTTGEKQPGRPQVRVTAKGIDALVKALTKVTDQGELTIEGDAA